MRPKQFYKTVFWERKKNTAINLTCLSFADKVVTDTDYTIVITVCSVTLAITLIMSIAIVVFCMRRRQKQKESDHFDQESLRGRVDQKPLYSRSNYPMSYGINMQQDADADEDYAMHRRGRLGGGGASMLGSQESLTEREEQSVRNIKQAIDEIRKVRR